MSEAPKQPGTVEILPREPTDEEQELRAVKAQAEAQVAVIEAFGGQLKTIVETPGVKDMLTSLGQAAVTRAQLAMTQATNEHALKMQQDANQAALTKRRDVIGLIVLFGGASFLVAVIALGVWAVKAGWLDEKTAIQLGAVIGVIFGAIGIGRGAKKS